MIACELSPKPDDLPGLGSLWLHKKGTLYRVVLVSRHTEIPDAWLVSYVPVDGGDAWTRAFSFHRLPDWPAFSDEDRFDYIIGPRTWREEPVAPDYRKLLTSYVKHVGNQEGTDFLARTTAADLELTEAEFAPLREIANEGIRA